MVGKIGAFDVNKDNWELYVERLEQYFVVNEVVKEEVKVATLITLIGNEAYELMVNLCTPTRPAQKKYANLCKVMGDFLQPKPSILAERFKFRQCRQKDESIAEYVSELKKLSKSCGFEGDSLTENLRDQFVCGIFSDSIRQRLFAEDNTTFENAFKLAVTLEMAETNAAAVEVRTISQDRSAQATQVFQMTPPGARGRGGRGRGNRAVSQNTRSTYRGHQTGQEKNGSGNSSCYDGRAPNLGCTACGQQHDVATCKYRVFVCRVCLREGHLRKVCPKRTKQAVIEQLYNQTDNVKEDLNSSEEVYIYNHSQQQLNKYPPYIIKILVNNCNVAMEIDTGSAISCISFKEFKKSFPECKLMNCNLQLRYYTGETIKPKGFFMPIAQHNDVTKKLKLYVIDDGKTSLLGREWLEELNIRGHFMISCNNLNSKKLTFDFVKFSSRFPEVFEDGLGRFTGGKVGFHLRSDARPVYLRARPLAYALREPVERELERLVKEHVITPVESSDWATPIVPVMKKDGTIRVCGDFKLTLNKYLEVDRFPLPKVEDLLVKLHGGSKFTKIDFSQAYAQLELDESKKYTVINTHKGLFQYNRLIYGASSSPGIFQRKIEQLFNDMPKVGVFLDDVIITGSNDEEHLNTLEKVFERLQKLGLKVKREKCTFFADSVTYLGFVIDKEGIHTSPDKIKAIKEAPKPTNVSEVRSFIGLIMYYAKFVKNISTLLEPLYNLLKKDVKFKWSEDCNHAFIKVKEMLISSDVLIHYSPELPLVLTTDASSVGIGAVISHVISTPAGVDRGRKPQSTTTERPIAYVSRTLNSAERNYSQIEKEALSIIFGIRKFHQYLYGRKFILRTDHKPLVSIFGDKKGIPVMAASRLQRWAVLLAGYDYVIEYVRSEMNSADALSRLPLKSRDIECEQITYLNFAQSNLPLTKQDIREAITKDITIKKVIYYLQSGWPSKCNDEDLKQFMIRHHELYLDKGCVVWGYRLVIPIPLRKQLLDELHTGHLGMVKMKSLARSYMWWPGIDTDIEKCCRECQTCAQLSEAPPRAPPQPWPYYNAPWTRLHVDLLGPLQGKTYLVIIDATSKWIEIFHMKSTTAVEIIKVLRETFARFGLPKVIVSDNGPPFNSKEYDQFMALNGIKIIHSPIYHPASNGAAEAAVKLCKRALKKAYKDGIDPDIALQAYLMAYRNVEQATTGTSPAALLQGRRLRNRLDLLRGEDEISNRVQKEQMKQVAHAKGKFRDLNVGDQVWVRNYGGGEKWIKGMIEDKLGNRNYLVGSDNGPNLKRHVDQIRGKWNHTINRPESTLSEVQEEHRYDTQTTGSQLQPGTGPAHDAPTLQPSLPTPPSQPPPVSLPKRISRPVQRYGFEVNE